MTQALRSQGDGKTRGHLADKRRKSMKIREWSWFKRRSAIEPIVGHVKSDHRMNRNHLKGDTADMINAILAGCGFSLRKLPRAILLFFSKNGSTAILSLA